MTHHRNAYSAFLERVDALIRREVGFGRQDFVEPDWLAIWEGADPPLTVSDQTILDRMKKSDAAFLDLLALKGIHA